jgi:SsrA-binding protein
MHIQNRKARFEYHILKEYVAGLQLFGSEVKATKDNNASISEAFVYIYNGEAFIKGMHVGKFKGSSRDHEEVRDRKLLLNKKEIQSIAKSVTERGITVVPISLFQRDGKIKLRIGVAKGKKLYDKKETIKERDIKIQTQKELKIS